MNEGFSLKDFEDIQGFDFEDEFLPSSKVVKPVEPELIETQIPTPEFTSQPMVEAELELVAFSQDSPLTPGPFGGLDDLDLSLTTDSEGLDFEADMIIAEVQDILDDIPPNLRDLEVRVSQAFAVDEGFKGDRPLVHEEVVVLEPTVNPAPLIAVSAPAEPLPILSNNGREVQIPRITVHVFADRSDTLAAAERAGQDRRMSRATTQIRVGGVPAAINAYQYESTPPLIVVESMADARTLLTQIDGLADVCDTGTKVIIIGATNDIQLYRELMRRGVSEYLVAPIQPLQLISAIDGLFADPAQPFVGRSIAFVGARGGAGASALAHNTAYAMSERIGLNTVIVDYDLPFGTAGLDFNQDPLNGVVDALNHPDRLDATLLDRMMVRCSDKLSLFAAPATLDADWDIKPEAFEEVTSRIRATAPFVVLDLPHLWSTWMRQTLISADEVVVVATPDLASLRNAKNMVDLIKQGRPNDAPPRLVLNQVGMPGPVTTVQFIVSIISI